MQLTLLLQALVPKVERSVVQCSVGQFFFRLALSTMLMAVGIGSSALLAQSGSTASGQGVSFPKFGRKKAVQPQQQPWKFQGRLHLQQGSTEGYIVLQIDLAPNHYIYSVSPDGSPAPTKIGIVPSPSVKTGSSFSPDQPPKVIENDPVFQRRIEKHTDRVQFFVPCKLDPNADYKLTGLPVIEFNGQICSKDGVCIPVRGKKIPVEFAGFYQPESAAQTSGVSSAPVAVEANVDSLGTAGRSTR
jgi:hypothetical protein